jgi:concentrative nucleoside transporter, CNT family
MAEVIFRGIIGIAGLVAICYLLSNNRKAINWRLVGIGLSLQFIFALLVLRVGWVHNGFEAVASAFATLTGFSDAGSDFLLRSFVSGDIESPVINFAFRVLPTIIFFSAITSLLYYLGILQKIVFGFAWVMNKTMGLSGPESLSAAGNIFMGQTEAPLLVKPYIMHMTNSELMCLMTGGMATIAGGVLAAYINFLGGGDEAMRVVFATHLLSASIMSAPAAIVAAKILYPETQEINKADRLEIVDTKTGSNSLEAISIGTSDGIKLAVNVGAMLLVFIALLAMGNHILGWLGGLHLSGFLSINEMVAQASAGKYEALSLEYIFGILFAPLAWLIGTPTDDIISVGRLLGEKTILNEFVAYVSLAKMNAGNELLHPRSLIIATYALCGFSNIASIGIQIGGIGAIAPGKRAMLSKLGVRALIAGSVACFFTACIAGMLHP